MLTMSFSFHNQFLLLLLVTTHFANTTKPPFSLLALFGLLSLLVFQVFQVFHVFQSFRSFRSFSLLGLLGVLVFQVFYVFQSFRSFRSFRSFESFRSFSLLGLLGLLVFWFFKSDENRAASSLQVGGQSDKSISSATKLLWVQSNLQNLKLKGRRR